MVPLSSSFWEVAFNRTVVQVGGRRADLAAVSCEDQTTAPGRKREEAAAEEEVTVRARVVIERDGVLSLGVTVEFCSEMQQHRMRHAGSNNHQA